MLWAAPNMRRKMSRSIAPWTIFPACAIRSRVSAGIPISNNRAKVRVRPKVNPGAAANAVDSSKRKVSNSVVTASKARAVKANKDSAVRANRDKAARANKDKVARVSKDKVARANKDRVVRAGRTDKAVDSSPDPWVIR